MAASTTASKGRSRKRCRCCRHTPPHCLCKLDRPPPRPPVPVTTKPGPCQLIRFMSLLEIAYTFYKAVGTAVTTRQVSDAIRRLDLKNDQTSYPTSVHGAVVFRQQTMVHTTKLQAIHDYMEERYT